MQGDDPWASLLRLVLPDRWQAEAIQALLAGRDVIVDAPTGAGKTFIFERWVEQTALARRALFTVPTRALANDKFAEWRARGWHVGITTGDLTLEPEAPLVVATLEAVQHLVAESVAGSGSAGGSGAGSAGAHRLAARPFGLLVVDEYQWIGDTARGSHYEGLIAAARRGLQLLLLSGSVSNPDDVGAWLRRLGRQVTVVRTRDRPVPLEEVDADDLARTAPANVTGFWARRIAGALHAGLGPVLVFAPHRQDAERLARQFARELPLAEPLALTPEQEVVGGSGLAKLLRQRVAYHHSGLSYVQRAGLIEPLAKAGQLRAVVATLGLAAGINFSLRSVLVTAGHFRRGELEQTIQPHELLQMIGRAGRRGLDEVGYYLASSEGPRLGRAAQRRLKRAVPLPWAFLLRRLRSGETVPGLVAASAGRFFTEAPLVLGAEHTLARAAATEAEEPPGRISDEGTASAPESAPASEAATPPPAEAESSAVAAVTADSLAAVPGPALAEVVSTGWPLPCAQRTDTGRARLVRRERDPFPGCVTCGARSECLAFSPEPTLLWQWQRAGVLDRELRLTARGQIVACFLGPEGLALAAALEDRRYPLDDLLFDAADLFGTDRFAGTNPRGLGRLAQACRHTYRSLTIEGYLVHGLPPAYGWGASDVVRALARRTARPGEVVAEHETAGRGDVDRLMTEWRSLLRQIAAAPALEFPAGMRLAAAGGDRGRRAHPLVVGERWDTLRALARATLGETRMDVLPDLPALTVEQRRPVQHRFTRLAGSGGAGVRRLAVGAR